MKTAIFAYSDRGCSLAQRIQRNCFAEKDCMLYTIPRLSREGFAVISGAADETYREAFFTCTQILFIGAAGIAVRKIAPYVRDKKTDPAVLCIDERGTFTIPLLSGHIGGANALARQIAGILKATPVITTATDVNGKFAVDEWAARNGYAISDMKLAKEISARILEEDVPICSEFPIMGDLPAGTYLVMDGSAIFQNYRMDSVHRSFEKDIDKALWSAEDDKNHTDCRVGIYIGCRNRNPFGKTLHIIPPALQLGIGCRKGISKAAVEAAVVQMLHNYHIEEKGIHAVYSIDLKAQEPGLVEYCHSKGWPLITYTREELRSVPGDFTASQFVEQTVGVDNVCERAAMKEGGHLIAGKQIQDGVTTALAMQELQITFAADQ